MRKIKILLIALILILGGTLLNTTYAASRSLKANFTRPYDGDNLKYQYKVTAGAVDVVYSVVKIYDTTDKSIALYCLRGGIGFGATDVSEDVVNYAEIGEMHKDAKKIIEEYMNKYKTGNEAGKEINIDSEEQFIITKREINGTRTEETKTVNLYNAILWVIDEAYLPTDKTNNENKIVYDASEYRKELLDKAGIPSSYQEKITDNDIEVIQQLAIWYFTNYDEQKANVKPTVSQATKYPSQYLGIGTNGAASDFNIFIEDDQRGEALDMLYRYFVYGAIENADTAYKIDANGTRTKSIEDQKNEFDKTSALNITNHDIEGLYDYYEIGPIKFTGDARSTVDTTNIVLYDANGNAIAKDFEVYKQEETPFGLGDKVSIGKMPVYKFLDDDGKEVTKLVKGQKYKIRIYKAFEEGSSILPNNSYQRYDMTKFTLKATSSYYLGKATFLSAGNESQPVVEIEKEKLGEEDEITTKKFDLSLRKFITAIRRGEENVEIEDRTPSLDVSKLNAQEERAIGKKTTATYTHSKNKLTVETGDKVVYTIRIYNEGEIDGTATKITDYLPEGLELVPAEESTINAKYGWTLGEGRAITTVYLENKTIKAYEPTKIEETEGETWQKATVGDSGLYYADVQVECKVVKEVSGTEQSLRNIAEITADNGDDRDSTPDNVNKDAYNPPVDNSEYQEDDDDYEDLVLKPKTFDLSLRKFITKVERLKEGTTDKEEIGIASREPIIKITELKDGTSETAKYVHPKNTLSLKRGDIITYTIRVYNEGELDGYAKEVKDYLPEGLELVEGENAIWTVEGDTLTTDFLKNAEIPAYDKERTEGIMSTMPVGEPHLAWQQASDDETGLYYYDLTVVCRIKDDVADGAILKNVAEISVDESKPTDIDDRDSNPDNVRQDGEHNPGTEVEGYTPGEQDDDDFERVTVEPKEIFDLALRKYIVAVNGKNLEGDSSRIPSIDVTPLKSAETTADYNHKKHPEEVKKNDVITYRFTVYNEGEITGYVDSIKDYLPQGLEFDIESNTNFIEYKEGVSYTNEQLQGKEYAYRIQGNVLEILPISSVSADVGGIVWLAKLDAFNKETEELNSKSIDVKFKVTIEESNNDQVLTNVATMTYSSRATDVVDRDSSGEKFNVPTSEKLLEGLPGYKGKNSNKDDLTDKNYHYEGQQDDDDFEKIIIKGKPFDLALRKFITSIKRNGEELDINDRTPSINTETLINGTFDRNGKKEYTATYEHSKEPLVVKQGDIITYTLRIYNEGERAGYATEITDYIPEGLALIKDYKTNFDNGWKLPEDLNTANIMQLVGENGFYKTEEDVKNLKLEDFSATASLKDVDLITGNTKITTNDLNNKLIKAFDKNKTETEEGWQKAAKGEGGLYYKDVEVSFLVIAPNTCKDVLTNIAEVSDDKDEYGKDVTDRDSTPNNVKDENEDDDDYEPVILKYFDLALRKFITGVETNGKSTEVTSRIPKPVMGKDGNIVYEHSKEPVLVASNDIVIYTIRVYNEGTLAGYAEKVTDDIPDGLEYLPEHNVNKEYEWVMIDKDGKVTENVKDAVEITTDYLSKAKEVTSNLVVTDEETGKTVETKIRENIINPFDSSKQISTTEPFNPDYKNVQIAFKVTEPNTSDRIIVNSAQISEDSDHDEDSLPDKWNDGEDDQDKEYIYVKYFDLSLLKWVTQTIVTVDGTTTTTETNFKPNTGKTETTGIRDNKEEEPIAKVELDKKKLNKTTVKFAYKIRVTNEGEIAGYATEITDFIPEGLEFNEEDNKAYGWVKEGEDKVTTRALETVLLKPGESAELEIIFRWKNDKNNLGLKTNIAEITEDYNDHNSKDIDSVPDNKEDPYEKEQEDDDDFALVILSIKTGSETGYTLLITIVITMLATGIYLIKKYVLTY